MYWLKEKDRTREWASNLQVGDEVAIQSGSWHFRSWEILKVVKITPTGRINLEGGVVLNPDGSVRGENYYYPQPVTEEVRREIWRNKAERMARNKLDISKLSDNNLSRILQILEEDEEERSKEQ